MARTFIGVRDVDEETFRKFRAKTVEENMKLGDAITGAMKIWILDENKREKTRKNAPNPKNLAKISGAINPGKKVRWSEEVDEFLYGLKK